MRKAISVATILLLTACGGEGPGLETPDLGVSDAGGPDNGTWKTECFPDAGMCRGYRWQHEIISASCEIGKGCRCSRGIAGAVTTCPLPAGFRATTDAGLAAMLACCFGAGGP